MFSIFIDNSHDFILIKVSLCLKCKQRIISESHFSVFSSCWRSTRRYIFRLHSKCYKTFVAFNLQLFMFIFLVWLITLISLTFSEIRWIICKSHYWLIELRRWTQISIIIFIFIFWFIQILITIFILLFLNRIIITVIFKIISLCQVRLS